MLATPRRSDHGDCGGRGRGPSSQAGGTKRVPGATGSKPGTGFPVSGTPTASPRRREIGGETAASGSGPALPSAGCVTLGQSLLGCLSTGRGGGTPQSPCERPWDRWCGASGSRSLLVRGYLAFRRCVSDTMPRELASPGRAPVEVPRDTPSRPVLATLTTSCPPHVWARRAEPGFLSAVVGPLPSMHSSVTGA